MSASRNDWRMLRAAAIVATCLSIASVGIAYVAYWFTPAQATGYESSFLAANTSEIVGAAGFRGHFLEQGAGLPIVLIHGGGTWLYSFRHNLEPLAGFARVLALDVPGHGYTERTHSDALYDLETTDQVLLEFLDAEGIGQAALVGQSWGGTWAHHFAQRYPNA